MSIIDDILGLAPEEEPEAPSLAAPEPSSPPRPEAREEGSSCVQAPAILACGHMGWPYNEASDCVEHRGQVFWQVRGLREPTPASRRRSAENPDGLCYHPDTHLYIGGLGNDCRYYSESGTLCPFHTKQKGR